jgi:ABC-type transporter Mla MlaB component
METDTVILDCARMTDAGLAAVDHIAHARLEAQRHGCRFELRNASDELLELIAFVGLDGCLGVEVQGQPE